MPDKTDKHIYVKLRGPFSQLTDRKRLTFQYHESMTIEQVAQLITRELPFMTVFLTEEKHRKRIIFATKENTLDWSDTVAPEEEVHVMSPAIAG